jgi:ATP-dependent DNA helicase RecQ
MYIIILRGATFRKEFSKLGDLHGFFPSSLNVMALTATASLSTRKEVMKLLGMLKPVTIVKSPDKPNIVYRVAYKNEEMEEAYDSSIH